MSPWRRALGVCISGWVAFLASSASAEESKGLGSEERRDIELRVVHATPLRAGQDASETWVDPQLEVFRGKIKRCAHLEQFGRYRQVKAVVQHLGVDERGSVLVTEHHRVEIVPTAFEGARTALHVRVVEEQLSARKVRQAKTIRGELHPRTKAPRGTHPRTTIEVEAETHPDGAFLIGPVPHDDGTILVIIRQAPDAASSAD